MAVLGDKLTVDFSVIDSEIKIGIFGYYVIDFKIFSEIKSGFRLNLLIIIKTRW